ncbi:MAG: O-acetyl-ADP-ribose deacetylase [Verrucomicrobia bacterium]|nr:MAG: O-acetyl-ADP-ribose deacetylase [Verrucomicrobiota bacterium]
MNPASERLRVIEGDITTLAVDALVNAANSTLLGGGGVDGAIHRAAGTRLFLKCAKLGGCATGNAKITPGFKLRAKWVIHTVGPVWSGGGKGEDELLASCYRSSLKLAREHNIRTIAFPAISTGVYRFPLDRATRIAVETCRAELAQKKLPEQVTFVAFSPEAFATYQRELSAS